MTSLDFHNDSEGGNQHYCYLTNGEGEAKAGPELTQGHIATQEVQPLQVLVLPSTWP